MKQTRIQLQNGQAMITMLYMMVIGVLVTTGAVYALFTNISIASLDERGLLAHAAAESGIENGLLRLIRNPSYTGETLVFDAQRSAIITVASTSSQMITSVGIAGNTTRKITAAVQYINGIFTITSWKDVP
jgi:protein-S-isoprenylcysteine O-methyltransferase Ste14